MIKPPERPVGPDFDKARDWAGQQERLMTEAQRRDYDKLKQQQARERLEKQQELDKFRKELEKSARQRQTITELVYNPPVKMADPHVKQVIANVFAAEKDLSKLDDLHKDQRIKKLEVFEQQRSQSKEKASKNLNAAFSKAAQDRSLKRAFDKAARLEAARAQRERDHERDRGRS